RILTNLGGKFPEWNPEDLNRVLLDALHQVHMEVGLHAMKVMLFGQLVRLRTMYTLYRLKVFNFLPLIHMVCLKRRIKYRSITIVGVAQVSCWQMEILSQHVMS